MNPGFQVESLTSLSVLDDVGKVDTSENWTQNYSVQTNRDTFSPMAHKGRIMRIELILHESQSYVQPLHHIPHVTTSSPNLIWELITPHLGFEPSSPGRQPGEIPIYEWGLIGDTRIELVSAQCKCAMRTITPIPCDALVGTLTLSTLSEARYANVDTSNAYCTRWSWTIFWSSWGSYPNP